MALTEYFLVDDLQIKHEKLKKGCFFGGTLLCFHMGVALAYILHLFFAVKAILFLLILLIVNFAYFTYYDKYHNINIFFHPKKMI